MIEMVGNVEVSVAKMEVQVERLEKDMAELKDDVKAIRAVLDKADGGWRVLMIVGTLSAALGSFLTKMIPIWPFAK